MRSAEVLEAVRARFGPTVTALRPSLAGPAPAPERPTPRRTAPGGPAETRRRRAGPRGRRRRAGARRGARLHRPPHHGQEPHRAPGRGPPGAPARRGRARRLRHHADERDRARRGQDHHAQDHHDPARPPGGQRQGEAYDHYVIAQMEARAGRMPQAIAQLREAIKLDPDTAVLWIQLSQWLIRDQRHRGRLQRRAEGRRARAQQRGRPHDDGRPLQAPAQAAEAEAELERAVALDPQTPDGYLALAQHHFEGKSYDKARAVLRRLVSAARISSQGTTCSGASASRTSSGTRRSPVSSARWSSTPITTRRGPRSASSTRAPEQARRGGRGLQGSAQGQPGQRGLRGAAGRPARAARALRRGPERDRGAGRSAAARSRGCG